LQIPSGDLQGSFLIAKVMRKIAINLETQKRNASCSLPVIYFEYVMFQGSVDNQWLVNDNKIVAYGKMENGEFVVINQLEKNINPGTKINIEESDMSHCNFPVGTRVKVAIN
jgi:hypothetical protein